MDNLVSRMAPALAPTLPRLLGAVSSLRAPISTSAVAQVAPAVQEEQEVAPASKFSTWADQLLSRPRFHIAPLHAGWINDPNGIHWDPATGLYHMFYQHYPTGSQWRWGLTWGHATSRDLLSWHHLEPVLHPTPEGADADGVWSGCAFPTDEGIVILNTAVRLRDNTPAGQLPPAHLDLGLQMVESQAYALADSSDPLLRTWRKGDAPLLPHPPVGNLTGWRDPFLVGQPGDGLHDKWTMIIGAGYNQPTSAGTALVYTSDSPTSGWQYHGELCRGSGKDGSMWECPLLAKLPTLPAPAPRAAQLADKHLLVVCPDNAHHAPVYYMGDYDAASLKFDLEGAGPAAPLDLGGPTFYAPNLLMNDPHGRLVMWGWCQELGRPAGDYRSACCMSQPRVLSRHPDHPHRVWQEPLDALHKLRMPGDSWESSEPLSVQPDAPLPLDATDAHHMEIEVTLQRPRSSKKRVCKTALVFQPAQDESEVPPKEASGRHGAALLLDWNTNRLEVVYSDGSVPIEELAALPSSRYLTMNSKSHITLGPLPPGTPRRVHHEDVDEEEDEMDVERRALNIEGCHMEGGQLLMGPEDEQLTLRVFLDHSLLEVFTSTGQVLTSRIYHRPEGVDAATVPPGILLASFGAVSTITHCAVHHMDAIWESPDSLVQLEGELMAAMQAHTQEQAHVCPGKTLTPVQHAPAPEQAHTNGLAGIASALWGEVAAEGVLAATAVPLHTDNAEEMMSPRETLVAA